MIVVRKNILLRGRFQMSKIQLNIRSYYRPVPKRAGEGGRTTPALCFGGDRNYIEWYHGLCRDIIQNENVSDAFAEMLALYANAKGYSAPPDRL